MDQRIILHMDMDYFFAQIEERDSPQFRGKPLVVGADPKGGKGRGVVSTANYKAREYGIHSALPISLAWKACPQAIFVPVNGAYYAEVSQRIMRIVRSLTCNLEQVSLDEAYVDVSFLGDWAKAKRVGEKLRRDIFTAENLTCSVGIGENKMMAKIACEMAKPSFQPQANGVFVILPSDTQGVLASLPVEKIPGIGKKTKLQLRSLLRRRNPAVEDLRAKSKKELRKIFGKHGEYMYDRARGIDESPVATEESIKSIGREYTFETDTRDPETILTAFKEILEDMALELKEKGFSWKTVTVVCRFQGFETHTKSKTLSEQTVRRKTLQSEAIKLLLRFLLEDPRPVRLVGIRASKLAEIEV
ncbi:MAG: DNA polymerase IV [Candidatus Yanofskybacteria bacterium]|nr:DNA polymerase IV [Candidatus Yanofskybacteria bacterium]